MKYEVKKEFERREKAKVEQNRQDRECRKTFQNIVDGVGLLIMLLLALFFIGMSI